MKFSAGRLPMPSSDRIRVGVLGATGYSGIEAVRILAGHPFVELSVLTSEHYAGREVAEVYRHMAGIDLPPFEDERLESGLGQIEGRAQAVVAAADDNGITFRGHESVALAAVVFQNLHRRQATRGAHDAAAGMGGGAAHV